MRQIGIKQFQSSLYKEMKDLPFTVTSRNKILFDVVEHKEVVTSPEESANTNSNVTTYTVSDKPLGLDPLPEDGTILAMEGIPHNKPKELEDSTLTPEQAAPYLKPIGRCQIKEGCKGFGQKYRVTFYSDEGEGKKDLFLCPSHLKKARDSDIEVTEL